MKNAPSRPFGGEEFLREKGICEEKMQKLCFLTKFFSENRRFIRIFPQTLLTKSLSCVKLLIPLRV
jgi:hypothetical protein